jgi:DNA-binding transcriptional regulator of glucitol operon
MTHSPSDHFSSPRSLSKQPTCTTSTFEFNSQERTLETKTTTMRATAASFEPAGNLPLPDDHQSPPHQYSYNQILELQARNNFLEEANRNLQLQSVSHGSTAFELALLQKEYEKVAKKEQDMQIARQDEERKHTASLQEIEHLKHQNEKHVDRIQCLEKELAESLELRYKLQSLLEEEEQSQKMVDIVSGQMLSDLASLSRKQAEEEQASQNRVHEEEISQLRSKAERLENKNANLTTMLGESDNIITSLEAKLETAEYNLKWAKISREEHSAMQAKIVSELEQTIKDMQPLADVGVAIRFRFLEQARETVYALSREEVDRELIKKGNMAAHRANGRQDAALFKRGLLPADNRTNMWLTFDYLYEAIPTTYPRHTPRMERLMDCEATLKSLRRTREQYSATFERDEYERVRSFLATMYEDVKQDRFEVDDKVKGLLEELESITEKIVETEKKSSRGGRR